MPGGDFVAKEAAEYEAHWGHFAPVESKPLDSQTCAFEILFTSC